MSQSFWFPRVFNVTFMSRKDVTAIATAQTITHVSAHAFESVVQQQPYTIGIFYFTFESSFEFLNITVQF